MSETPSKNVNVTYQALSSMSRLFYEKYGNDAIPIIREVWYKLGLDSGERLKNQSATYDFKSAAHLIEQERSKKRNRKVTGQIFDNEYHMTTYSGYPCNVGLKEDDGPCICEAVMSINQGQFKAICGCDIEMNIIQSRAKGDDHCRVVFRRIDAPVK